MRIVKITVVLFAAAALFFAAQRVLMPKYMSDNHVGALIGEYYDSEKDHQIVFIGDCEVYGNFSPATLWTEYGLTSYIRGGPQQLIWQSYYMLEDTLRYETPDVVVFNVLSMKYATPQSEAFNRLNLDGMRWSLSKLHAVRASMTQGEDWLSYFIPLLRYHDRWKELTFDDLRYAFTTKKVSVNGFVVRCDVKPVDVIPTGLMLADYTLSPVCWDYLDRMRELCEKNGIAFVLVKAPSISPRWYDEWDAQLVDYADRHGLLYLNLLNLAGDAGIDFNTDTYDAGLHLNVYGAEKLSRYFGAILADTFGLADLRGDAKTARAWEQKVGAYEYLKQTQEQELQKYGGISTFTY